MRRLLIGILSAGLTIGIARGTGFAGLVTEVVELAVTPANVWWVSLIIGCLAGLIAVFAWPLYAPKIDSAHKALKDWPYLPFEKAKGKIFERSANVQNWAENFSADISASDYLKSLLNDAHKNKVITLFGRIDDGFPLKPLKHKSTSEIDDEVFTEVFDGPINEYKDIHVKKSDIQKLIKHLEGKKQLEHKQKRQVQPTKQTVDEPTLTIRRASLSELILNKSAVEDWPLGIEITNQSSVSADGVEVRLLEIHGPIPNQDDIKVSQMPRMPFNTALPFAHGDKVISATVNPSGSRYVVFGHVKDGFDLSAETHRTKTLVIEGKLLDLTGGKTKILFDVSAKNVPRQAYRMTVATKYVERQVTPIIETTIEAWDD